MNGKSFEFEPHVVPHVETKYRKICTPIPVPESKDVIERLRNNETISMTGQPLVVWDHAEGANVYDAYGNKWIDFSSGVMIANVGHANPEVQAAVRAVVDKPLMCSYLFPTEERAKAAERIVSVSPIPDSKCFMLSAGTEAVETAMKLARTYAHKKYGMDKNVLITFNGAFHGRTLGSQEMGGMPSLKEWIKHQDPEIILADFPNKYLFDWADPDAEGYSDDKMFEMSIIKCIEDAGFKPENVAGILTESYQGIYCCPIPVPYAKRLREFCDKYDIVLFMDEIQTGFCRTGKMFAFEHYGILPDMFTCAKGISGSLPIVSQKTLAFLQRGLMKRLLPVSGEADRTVHIAAVCRHERGGGGALTGVACKPGSRQLSLQLFLCQGQCFWRTSSSGHPLQEAGPIVLPDQRFKSTMIGTDFLHVNPVWMFCEFCGQFPQTDRADATGFTNQIHSLIFRRVFLLQGRPAQLHSLIPDTAPRIADSADLPLLAG